MVGIVIVSHSASIADGVVALASQMTAGQAVAIAGAGGTDDDGIGTSLEKIQQALDSAYSDDGVLILMDLGSAVMTTEMLLEMLPPEQRERVRMTNAPLIEGAIAAAAAAAQGDSLDGVRRAAESALDYPKIPEEPAADAAESVAVPQGPGESAELPVPNPVGLHARPAALFVQTAARFQSQVTVQNVTQRRPAVDAKSLMQVANLGTARQGETIRVVARGDDARQAIEALTALVEAGFGEMEGAEAVSVPRAPVQRVGTPMEIPDGPPPALLQGIGVSEGTVVAPAHVFLRLALRFERATVTDPQTEGMRFRTALEVAAEQLERVQQQVSTGADEQTGRIFEFHRLMLEDAGLIDAIEQMIQTEACNAEAAVDQVFAEWVERFDAMDDELMRARAADVQDVRDRVLRVLLGKSESSLSRLPGPVIIVADDLVPSETALLDRKNVRGLATALGGATSHTAILARMLGIPAVVGLGPSILAVSPGTTLALDGESGRVEVEPPEEAVRTYQTRESSRMAAEAEALKSAAQPAATLDGRRVEVVANIGDIGSAQEAIRYGAEGVGLLRTEFLYLGRTTLPGEEEQYAAYRAIAEAMGQRPLIVRTLDVGGDKQLPYLEIGPELNPFLGVRAIRLSLEQPEVFQPQLRAILRAGSGHNVKIMFPMVSTRDEIVQAKMALQHARNELEALGVAHVAEVEVGIMVETPASAVLAPALAEEVDFFSIGSNDLTQYTLAADRGNERLSHLYRPLDPAVLYLIRRVIDAGHAAGIWVGLCGELAGQHAAIPILLGLGLDEFSMTPRAIPRAKRLIRMLDYAQTQSLAGEVLHLSSATEVEERMTGFLKEMGEQSS